VTPCPFLGCLRRPRDFLPHRWLVVRAGLSGLPRLSLFRHVAGSDLSHSPTLLHHIKIYIHLQSEPDPILDSLAGLRGLGREHRLPAWSAQRFFSFPPSSSLSSISSRILFRTVLSVCHITCPCPIRRISFRTLFRHITSHDALPSSALLRPL
jgi:hypothetical protein